jgi:hypothetical protein
VTFIAEGSTRVVRHAAQVTCVVAAQETSPTIFTIRWRTVELDLGGLRQPFGVPELLLGRQLSLEEVNPHLAWHLYSRRCWTSSQRSRFSSCAGDRRCRPGGCLASRKSLCPRLEVWDSCECLMAKGFDAASTLLTMHSRRVPSLGGAGGTARSLHSRAMSADWPRMSRRLGRQSRCRDPSLGHCDTTGSDSLLPGWVPLVGRFPKHLCGRQESPMPSLLLPRSQVIAFASSCFRTQVPHHPRKSLLATFGWPNRRPRVLGLSPCLCLSAQAFLIFADQEVVAFLVVCLTP